MKIKLYENMPEALTQFLGTAGHDVSTVDEEGLSGHDDVEVLNAAVSEERLLMTFDTDFADIRRYPPGRHAGIVVFRLADQRWAILQESVRKLIELEVLEQIDRGLAVVDEFRVRTRPSKSD